MNHCCFRSPPRIPGHLCFHRQNLMPADPPLKQKNTNRYIVSTFKYHDYHWYNILYSSKVTLKYRVFSKHTRAIMSTIRFLSDDGNFIYFSCNHVQNNSKVPELLKYKQKFVNTFKLYRVQWFLINNKQIKNKRWLLDYTQNELLMLVYYIFWIKIKYVIDIIMSSI